MSQQVVLLVQFHAIVVDFIIARPNHEVDQLLHLEVQLEEAVLAGHHVDLPVVADPHADKGVAPQLVSELLLHLNFDLFVWIE